MATITLSDLDHEQIALLVAQIKADEAQKVEALKVERAAAKVLREQGRAITLSYVEQVVNTLPSKGFKSGAQGYSLGGAKYEVAGKTFRVSVLIRDEATIPAKDEDDTEE